MNLENVVPSFAPISDGDVLTVTLTARRGAWMTPAGVPVLSVSGKAGTVVRRAGKVLRPAPSIKFIPGDVVVLKHSDYDEVEYTHVRGRHGFLGDTFPGPTDEKVATAFSEGRARLIARNGVALPGPITRDNAHLLTTIPF